MYCLAVDEFSIYRMCCRIEYIKKHFCIAAPTVYPVANIKCNNDAILIQKPSFVGV